MILQPEKVEVESQQHAKTMQIPNQTVKKNLKEEHLQKIEQRGRQAIPPEHQENLREHLPNLQRHLLDRQNLRKVKANHLDDMVRKLNSQFHSESLT